MRASDLLYNNDRVSQKISRGSTNARRGGAQNRQFSCGSSFFTLDQMSRRKLPPKSRRGRFIIYVLEYMSFMLVSRLTPPEFDYRFAWKVPKNTTPCAQPKIAICARRRPFSAVRQSDRECSYSSQPYRDRQNRNRSVHYISHGLRHVSFFQNRNMLGVYWSYPARSRRVMRQSIKFAQKSIAIGASILRETPC